MDVNFEKSTWITLKFYCMIFDEKAVRPEYIVALLLIPMMNTEIIGQDGSNPSTVDMNSIGPHAPPWFEKPAVTGDSSFHDELLSYDGDDHGSEWVNPIAARSVSNRMKGLQSVEKQGYDLNSIVPSSIGEVTQLPPEFHETYRDSAAGIDPATDTGHAITSNCSGRKNVGEVLSNSTEIDGTAGSDRNMEHDLSGVKALLRLHGQPTQLFGEDIYSARLRLKAIFKRNTHQNIPLKNTVSGFTPTSPGDNSEGGDTHENSQEGLASSGKLYIFICSLCF